MLAQIAVLVLLWWLSRQILPHIGAALMPRLNEKLAAIVAVVAALFVLLHGNLYLALLIFGISLWLLGRSTRRTAPLPAGVARIVSKRIEMDLDRATGAMSGRVLAGPDAGQPLDNLDRARCQAIYLVCCRDDSEGVRLLEAYLDRRFPGWRATGQADGDARSQQARSTGGMSLEQAYQVLGLGHGATREDIVRAHRSAMKKWHPDQGGTAALAARANEAKEVLLRPRA